MGRFALEGVKVLDFSWVGVAPITTKYLADNGAEVIRIESAARLDVLRIDLFRALAAYWAIPAGAPDARSGAWLSTPGEHLLHRLREAFPDMPLVAEDLGVITADVLQLKNGFGLPGMRVHA